jgi:hypothetical protein
MDIELICPYVGLEKRSHLSQKTMSYVHRSPLLKAFSTLSLSVIFEAPLAQFY